MLRESARTLAAVVAAGILVTAVLLAAPANGVPGAGQAAFEPVERVSKKKQKRLNKRAKKAIRNGRYIGTRGDGQSVDATFCRNGRYEVNVGGGISKGKRWSVKNAKFNKRGFTAIIRSKVQGGFFSVAIGRLRGQWKFGIEYFGKPSQFGNVQRSKAGARCRQLANS